MSDSFWPQASLSFTKSQSLLKLMSIELLMPSNHLILCCSLPLLPSVFPSIRVLFQWVSSSHQVAKLLELQLQHQSFQWIFRTDFLQDGLVGSPCVQGTLKSLPQHHSSKASILQRSAFFIGQLSHPYMTTGKTIALTRRTFVGKVMSLLLNMLSRLVITFLPRSKHLLISCLQSPSAVILELQKKKVWHCFHCFPIYFPWSDAMMPWPDAMILVFWMLSFKPTFSLSSFTFLKRLLANLPMSSQELQH